MKEVLYLRNNSQYSNINVVRRRSLEDDLFKGGFSHANFIKLMHHCHQEDFTQPGTSLHYLKDNQVTKLLPRNEI